MGRIHVVAAVIERDRKVLIARRPQHLHQGGKWEFPGGKVESGEAALVAPFKYTSVLWAILFGFLMFGDFPESEKLAGVAVVIVSGIYILHRERKVRYNNN